VSGVEDRWSATVPAGTSWGADRDKCNHHPFSERTFIPVCTRPSIARVIEFIAGLVKKVLQTLKATAHGDRTAGSEPA
jgi:hypothetical protein